MRWLLAPLVAASLAACGGGGGYYDEPYPGDYYGGGCNPAYYPAVEVRFVDTYGQPILIGARGSIYDGAVTQEMSSPEPGFEIDGRTTVLQGAFGQIGVFDVSVATLAGERYDWAGIQVSGDGCRIFTAPLTAVVHFPDP